MAKKTTTYTHTLYIVRVARDDHRPYLVVNNGKLALNESVTRAVKLERSWNNLGKAFRLGSVRTERIGHKEFRQRFPSFAPNAGKKRTSKVLRKA